LTINSNSSTNATLTINLNANTSGHRVELNWNPPADSSNPVSSYKVYRATGSTGTFAKLAATGQPTYTDTAVQSGSSYKYYVTSVGSAGESKPSNTFTGTIP
jgi:fibronectin type 3 domain-containing protein